MRPAQLRGVAAAPELAAAVVLLALACNPGDRLAELSTLEHRLEDGLQIWDVGIRGVDDSLVGVTLLDASFEKLSDSEGERLASTVADRVVRDFSRRDSLQVVMVDIVATSDSNGVLMGRLVRRYMFRPPDWESEIAP